MAAAIVLDPGHGGDAPCPGERAPFGAQGASGTWEKVYTLDIALRVRDILRCSGIKAVLTRETDVCISLDNRHELADRLGLPLVSIHFNSASSRDAEGSEAYWWSGNGQPAESLRLAETLLDALVARLGTRRRGVFDRGLRVLTGRTPAALVEVGFINNPEEERRLVGSSSARHQVALALAEGIGAFLGVRVEPCPPRWPLVVGGLLLVGAFWGPRVVPGPRQGRSAGPAVM